MNKATSPSFTLTNSGDFVIDNYNASKNFSSFFPGIAGKSGIPMWVFYVNRGQCICSMGIEDKDKPIMEFLSANWAYQLVSSQGFRTFLKFPESSELRYYEPFQDHFRDSELVKTQRMVISPSHLVLVEENKTLGLKFTVEYHTVPEDNYAGLIRTLHIENIGQKTHSFQGLDGLPLIIPYGLSNGALKHIRRLTEAFVEVTNYEQSAPLFKGKVEPADRPEVVHIEKGNFYVGLEMNPEGSRILKPIVDPQRIFGSHSDYSYPKAFLSTDAEEIFKGQAFENRLPAAMSLFEAKLSPGQTYTLTSIIGHIDSKEALNNLLPTITQADYLEHKKRSNQQAINAITLRNMVVSSQPKLDLYTRQNFLDNVLRGGYPYTLKGKQAQSVIHLYSRKHGDLERDYNDYRITPTHYSQGNGNYRDVNQNRRSDLFFNPDVQSNNLEHFYNLIQLDGFNPLVIKELRYLAKDVRSVAEVLEDYLTKDHSTTTLEYLRASKTPGEILAFLHSHQFVIHGNSDEFLGDLLDVCHKINDSEHGEGYWSDHWTYNLDLLENYLAVYPEQTQFILFEKQSFTFHESPYRVKARDDKYVLWDGKPMQLEAVFFDDEKNEQLNDHRYDKNFVRAENGHGDVYYTFLVVKLLSIITNKIASLDPSGVGVEMETDKPNWYDALNGLPALIGSSLSETLELKRHILFLHGILAKHAQKIADIYIFEELLDFILNIKGILNNTPESFIYWDETNTVKEKYRLQIKNGISGIESSMSTQEVVNYLELCLAKVNIGIDLAWDEDRKIPSTYFSHSIDDYKIIQIKDLSGAAVDKVNSKGLSCFRVSAFTLHHLPHFLEGPVHFLRCQPHPDEALKLVQNIKESDLYDKKLGMYKVNAPLTNEPHEIGRARTFSPGWFENESIWLHMEYKYMYEMLRNGLYDFFFDEFKQILIPFQNPEVYGRSILENSSFLVSSANPDPNLHGMGFVARLSGATAEFIQILLHIAMGPTPFIVNDSDELIFQPKPSLPAWLFTSEAQTINQTLFPARTFSFMFLGEIMVTYHNESMSNTFGVDGVQPKRFRVSDSEGNNHEFEGAYLPNAIALSIRARQVSRIDIILAKLSI